MKPSKFTIFSSAMVLAAATAAVRAGATLQLSYATKEEIPAGYEDLYTQQGDKFNLTGVTGVKTQADIDRVQEALRKEREDHKAAKTALAAFTGMNPEEVRTKLDRLEELELANGGKLDEAKINEIADARVRSKTAPLERQIQTLTNQLAEKEKAVGEYTQREKTRAIHDHIRTAAGKAKLRDTAVEDALFLGERVFDVNESGEVVTRDGVGVTPGVNAEVWLSEQQEKRPHWWPESTGVGAKGGSGGSGVSNPFSHDGWNLTLQGQMVRENRTKAEQMAKAAGTTIGGQRPVKK